MRPQKQAIVEALRRLNYPESVTLESSCIEALPALNLDRILDGNTDNGGPIPSSSPNHSSYDFRCYKWSDRIMDKHNIRMTGE